jgi:hypothetical protein
MVNDPYSDDDRRSGKRGQCVRRGVRENGMKGVEVLGRSCDNGQEVIDRELSLLR